MVVATEACRGIAAITPTMTDSNDRNDTDRTEIGRRTALKGGAAGLAALGLGTLGAGTAAAESADKIYTTGSTLEKLDAEQKNSGDTNSGPVTLLSGEVKLSTPTDLLIYTTMETSLFTSVKQKGKKDDASRAEAGVYGWIEIDGIPVPVDASGWDGDTTVNDDERVVFDRRAYSLDYYDLDDDETMIESYIGTRSAQGFNWFALNIDSNFGSGDTHTVELKGKVELEVDNDGEASALVGDRTMFVQPVKLPNGATY